MPRMNILNAVEREAFESPPVFNSVQRKQYFHFPTELRRLAGEPRAPTHQLGFLLSAGYFKAAKFFFPPSAFHRRDLEYVARQLELEDLSFDFSDYNPRTRQLHEMKIASIRTLLATRETQRLLQKNQVAMLKEALVSELSEDDYYRILESKSVWIQNRVGPILKALTFQGDPGARKLLEAIEHFIERQGTIDKTAPVTFLDPTEVAAVNKDSKFRVSLYKALLFLHVQSAIKSGGLNLEQSYKYRRLDDYLIDRARWQRDKQQLIERAGLEAFVDPHKVLDKLDEALHRQYLISNGNIIEGKNPFIKFGKNGGFTLATPKQEESDAEPLQHFFPERSYVPLLEILIGLFLRASVQKPQAPAALYLQEPPRVRPFSPIRGGQYF